jgi:hypothetical protein
MKRTTYWLSIMSLSLGFSAGIFGQTRSQPPLAVAKHTTLTDNARHLSRRPWQLPWFPIRQHLKPLHPAKNGIFEPFIYKNEHFAKTGSGQT